MEQQEYIADHAAFVFELDDVLYPEKDYLLQVYYLFAQFIEYGEQIDAQQIVRFMQDVFEQEGSIDIFAKTALKFNLAQKYKQNFDLLHQNARLPLKLLLFAPVLSFLEQVKAAGKPIFLVAAGDPEMQLNKIRQMEWNGLETYLKLYFTIDMPNLSFAEALKKITLDHNLKAEEILLVAKAKNDSQTEDFGQIKFITTNKLSVS